MAASANLPWWERSHCHHGDAARNGAIAARLWRTSSPPARSDELCSPSIPRPHTAEAKEGQRSGDRFSLRGGGSPAESCPVAGQPASVSVPPPAGPATPLRCFTQDLPPI